MWDPRHCWGFKGGKNASLGVARRLNLSLRPLPFQSLSRAFMNQLEHTTQAHVRRPKAHTKAFIHSFIHSLHGPGRAPRRRHRCGMPACSRAPPIPASSPSLQARSLLSQTPAAPRADPEPGALGQAGPPLRSASLSASLPNRSSMSAMAAHAHEWQGAFTAPARTARARQCRKGARAPTSCPGDVRRRGATRKRASPAPPASPSFRLASAERAGAGSDPA